jgi:hypothetical protein
LEKRAEQVLPGIKGMGKVKGRGQGPRERNGPNNVCRKNIEKNTSHTKLSF